MKHVRLRLTADGREGELHPMYGVMANADFVEYAAALDWNITDGELSILHYVEGDAGAFEAALDDVALVRGYELERAGDDAFYAYHHSELTGDVAELWAVGDRPGVVTVPPIEWHADGTVRLSVFGPGAELQAAVDVVPDPVSATVEEVSGLQAIPGAVPASLSTRQREAVETAVDVGYYDVPRTGDQDDVAERLGCSPSTAAEHLRKAESKVLRSLFG